jgi:hypothetical protein
VVIENQPAVPAPSNPPVIPPPEQPKEDSGAKVNVRVGEGVDVQVGSQPPANNPN